MRSACKKLFSFLLIVAVVCSFSVSVFAADSSVTFLGFAEGFEFAPGSVYTDTDMFDNFKNVMPGDRLTETIDVTNRSTDSDYIQLYMRAVIHDETENPLSPNVAATGETVATMHDFLAQLSMRVYHGESLIYEASPDELDGLAENVLLGSFRSGESTVLTVELDVPIELGTEYEHRTGEVDWLFTVEGFDDPVPPPQDDTRVTVKKIWDDGNDPERPESVTVNLLRDGKIYDTVTLRDSNHWTYTWSRLDDDDDWTVREAEVPEGYTVDYERSGHVTYITNTKEQDSTPAGPVDLTVQKKWADTKDQQKNRPDSVKVTLFNDKTAVETVLLGDWNNWSYTWNDLSGDGKWSVAEVEIPKGYTPNYSASGDVVTITNSTIADTGQLNWPIFVFGGLGIVLLTAGMCMTFRRRKNDHA